MVFYIKDEELIHIFNQLELDKAFALLYGKK